MDRAALRIVMTVDNGVVGDSRVIKSARSAREAGYDVLVIGYGTTQPDIAGVDALLVPGKPAQRESSVLRWALRNVAMDPGDIRAYRARAREQSAVRRVVSRATVAVRWRLNRFAGYGPRELDQTYRLAAKSQRLADRWGVWEHLDPHVAGLNRGIVEALVDAEPDIIHVHDYRTLPAAAAARTELERRGRTVRIVYDAHEYVPGLNEIGENRLRAATMIESRNIDVADAVISVSDALALRMQRDHGLPEVPTVVVNAPVASSSRAPGRNLRQRLGLGDDVALLVYSGSVGGSRALTHLVDVMAMLPEVHVALVVSHPTSNVMEALKERATERGVLDRFHLTRYVRPEHLVEFLSGADIGLVPLRHTENVQDSLPSKTYEFLAAGLPQVVSDQRELAAFVKATGIGESFEADSADDMARAVEAVLGDLQRYRAAITEELKSHWTWDAQAVKLVAVYDRLATGLHNPPKTRAGGVHGARVEGDPGQVSSFPTPPAGRPSLAVGAADPGSPSADWAAQLENAMTFGRAGELPIADQEIGDPEFIEALLSHLCGGFSHVLLESGRTVTGASTQPLSIGQQVERLEEAGVLVGQVFHADDLDERNPPERVYEIVETAKWLGLPRFVTSPELRASIPGSIWVPMVVEPSSVTDRRAILSDRVPVVLFAGSAGTESGSALRKLDEQGVIELLLVEAATASTLARLRRLADVFVDDLDRQGYGLEALEALAAGTLVIGRVGDEIRGAIDDDVPIMETVPCDLESRIREVVEEPERARQIAEKGPDFVKRWHLGDATRSVLQAFFGTAEGLVDSKTA